MGEYDRSPAGTIREFLASAGTQPERLAQVGDRCARVGDDDRRAVNVALCRRGLAAVDAVGLSLGHRVGVSDRRRDDVGAALADVERPNGSRTELSRRIPLKSDRAALVRERAERADTGPRVTTPNRTRSSPSVSYRSRTQRLSVIADRAYMKSAMPVCLFLSFSKMLSRDFSSTSRRCFV